MEKSEAAAPHTPHCLIFPYPLQGHMNPMLQFATRLSHKGVSITLALTKQFLAKSSGHFSSPNPFPLPTETISDGFDQGTPQEVKLPEYLARFRQVGMETLAALLARLRDSGRAVDCVIYGAFLPWAMAVAKEFGVVGAPFFTQSNGVNCIYYNLRKGELKIPVLPEEVVRVPGLKMEFKGLDMPSFLLDQEAFPGALDVVLDQFENAEEVEYVFVNTIYDLEEEVTNWMSKVLPVKTIGPTIPSMYLDKRITHDKDYGLNLFEPESSCTKWLDKHPNKSVIYVSFGSMAKFQSDQMAEFSNALKMTKRPFLWVVRSSELSKLPADISHEQQGLIVSWCPQLEVLSHASIGCFVTHCGWNSTLEALCLGVPMVGIPWWSDQSTNAKFVMDAWKVGVRAHADEENVVRKEEIVKCIEHVMDPGPGREEVRKNASKWKELARQAIDEGGSSDTNIEQFISELKLHKGLNGFSNFAKKNG